MLTFYATENKPINCKVGHDSADSKVEEYDQTIVVPIRER